jgi:transcriptional regulator with XRE-family HTH domain
MEKAGAALRTLRESQGLTQAQLAKKASVTQPYLSQLENGTRKNAPLATLRQLAKALGVRVLEVLDCEMRPIFIAHGERGDEVQKGENLKDVVRSCGIDAFLAKRVHSTTGLSQQIFSTLERSDGFLGIMHKRGRATGEDSEPFHRGSVWTFQEIGIVSFINHQRPPERQIKPRVFLRGEIKWEGPGNSTILNPDRFESDAELAEHVEAWLRGPDFVEDPLALTRERIFGKSVEGFGVEHWAYLELLMALARGTTDPVSLAVVDRMRREFGLSESEKDRARGDLLSRCLIGGSTLDPMFIDLVAEEIRRRGSFFSKRV